MEFDGYMIHGSWDGSTLRIRGTNRAAHLALAGHGRTEEVAVQTSQITGLKLRDARRLINGELVITTLTGQKYKLHFRRKQAETFRRLEAALAESRSADEPTRSAPAGSDLKLEPESGDRGGPGDSPAPKLGRSQRGVARKQAKELAQRREQWEREYELLQRLAHATIAMGHGAHWDGGLALRPGELGVWTGIGDLVEPRSTGGAYTSGTRGASIRVPAGVRVRVGGVRGKYAPGQVAQTVVDQGAVAVTSKRVVFTGTTRTREWTYSKLVSANVTDEHVLLHVSNRQRVSGLSLGPSADEFVAFLQLAMLVDEHGLAEASRAVAQELAAHLQQRP
ncbi:hypothetical protein [Actinocatenispora rupis]|uniref:Uncharacterized protein n=1 Tax=Actinocatenispora rupis TaxID=519421 RepID=A0A8J3NDZ3_9ACTN|nr:hypothetical protein [Actinocatenispora rupis]GID15799.1 hypothetical protein Aru02nite_66880 [Actinocatenispora rupis]